MDLDKVIDKTIDGVFNMKRSTIYLLLILLLGFILRLVAAINITVSADDMHHVIHAIDFFSAGRLITYDQSSGLWHAFTSIIYNVFGMTQLTSRTAALVFGSLTILVIFLLTREFFGEKVGLLAAFLLAVAPFHIKSTVAEMDVMAMFFVMAGMFLFVRSLKTEKLKYYFASGILIGLAVYTKVYPLLFIPSLLLYFLYYQRKKKEKIISSKNFKMILVFLVGIFILTVPALTHNYLLYQDKGFLDLQFTRTLGLGKDVSQQYYGWDVQFDAKNDWSGLIFGNSVHSVSKLPTLYTMVRSVYYTSPLNFILGFVGLFFIFLFRKNSREYVPFFFLAILFVLPFLASIITLKKHFIFLELLLIPPASLFLKEVINKLRGFYSKSGVIILILILAFSMIYLGLPGGLYPYYGKSQVAQMIDFKKTIPENSLIIGDSRIYRGQIHWFSQGRPYMEGIEFIQLTNRGNEIPGEIIPVDIYFFECVIDDCGWGTVKNQPEFNQSMEALVVAFQENGQLVKEISQPYEKRPYFPILTKEKEPLINIYRAQLPIKEAIYLSAYQPKNWFLYNVGYEPVEGQFDYYRTNGFFNKLLDSLAHLIVLLALILAFISPLFVLYWIRK